MSRAKAPDDTGPDDGMPEVLVCGELTDHYGIGLFRLRGGPAYWHNPPIDQHVVWLQYSHPVPVVTWLAGRRQAHETVPGSVYVYPGSAESICETGGLLEGVAIRVSAECLALAGSQLGAHGSRLVERINGRDDALFRIAQVLEAEAAAGYPNGTLFWSSAVDAFIRHLATHHMSEPAVAPRGAVSAEDLGRIDAYIHENLAGQLDLDSLATVIGCDRFQFARRFRATVGISPHRYVMRLRLERARERMRIGAGSLAEIAPETGFADQSHLCRWVRRVYNLRPSDLRG